MSEATEEGWAVVGIPDFTPQMTMDCPVCGRPKIEFPVSVVHASGVSRMHGVIACPDRDDPKQVVIEWRDTICGAGGP